MGVGMAGAAGEDGLPSPGNKIKFMCSHGGKILPRPSDGQLKYVGGETRVIAVPRSITFSELMKKLNSLFDSDVVLKYQLVPEDLDALVSVTCDEDLKHMVDEYDRHDAKLSGNCATPRLRAFLFPSNPVVVESHGSNSGETSLLEQRYIDAVNGFVRSSSNVGRSAYRNEPGSRDRSSSAEAPGEPPAGRFRSPESGMGRVHSSPNLLSIPNQAANHHPLLHSRLGRPGAKLQTARSDVARSSGQTGRRYCVAVGYPGGSGGYVGCARTESSAGLHRSGGSGEGEILLSSPRTHRLGPMGQRRE